MKPFREASFRVPEPSLSERNKSPLLQYASLPPSGDQVASVAKIAPMRRGVPAKVGILHRLPGYTGPVPECSTTRSSLLSGDKPRGYICFDGMRSGTGSPPE